MDVQSESVAIQIRPREEATSDKKEEVNRCHRIGIHLPLVVGDVIAVAGALITGFSNYSTLFPASYAILGGACFSAHYLVAKYGDLSRVAEKVNQATQQLTSRVSTLSEINEQLKEENRQLTMNQEQMAKNQEERQDSLKKLEKTVDELRQKNNLLETQVFEWKEFISHFQEKIALLKKIREGFKATFQQVQGQIAAFQEMQPLFNCSTEQMQTGLDKNLQELAAESERLNLFIKSVIEQFVKEREELKQRIQDLQIQKETLGQLQGRFADLIAKLGMIEKEAKGDEELISKVKESLLKGMKDLETDQTLFTQEKQKFFAGIEEEKRRVEQERRLIIQERKRLELLQKQFQMNEQAQRELNAQIEQEIKKWER